MDNKLLGNFIIYFPPIAYIAFTLVTHHKGEGIDWTEVILAAIIGVVSSAIGKRIKNKGSFNVSLKSSFALVSSIMM